MAIFVGEHSATIDDKGRIVLPSAFKKAMGEMSLDFVILEKNRLGNCLDIHTEQRWVEKVKEFQSKLNPLNPNHDKLLQVYFQNFTRIGVADNGRINIPDIFLKFANMKKKVKFVGMLTTIRLINDSEVAEPEMTNEEYLRMLSELNGGGEK
jgi:MraZ protein